MKIMMKKQQRRNVAVVKKVMGEWMKQLQQLRTCLETKYPQTKKRKKRLILFIMKFIFLNSFVKVKYFCSFKIYCNLWYKFKHYINYIVRIWSYFSNFLQTYGKEKAWNYHRNMTFFPTLSSSVKYMERTFLKKSFLYQFFKNFIAFRVYWKHY